MPVPVPVITAGISGITALLGSNKAAKSARESASVQERLSREALAEQRRIYEEERQRDEEERARERQREDEDRQRTDAEDRRVLGSRRNAFGGFNADLGAFSKGYAPAYGMSQEQTDEVLNRRNRAIPPFVPAPSRFDMVSGDAPPGQTVINGSGGGPVGGPNTGGVMPGGMTGSGGNTSTTSTAPPTEPMPPVTSSSMSPTVWLRAPNGEEMEIPIEEAPLFLSKGATLIPGPSMGAPR